MKKYLYLFTLSLVSFVLSNLSFAANKESIYDKVDLFGEVV